MIKTFSFFLLFSLMHHSSFAQPPCNDDIIMNIKGKWVKRPDANIKAGNQSLVTSRIDKMQQLLQAAYPEPKGIEAAWYRSVESNNSNKNGAATYSLNALFKAYYCNTYLKKLLLGDETGTWFYVWANKFAWFAKEYEKFPVENKPAYLLTQKTGELNGFPLYAGNDNVTSNTGTRFSKTILIARQGQLPYTAVTHKQYLIAFLKWKEDFEKKYVDATTRTVIWSDAEEEADKQKQLEKAEKSARPNEADQERAKNNFLRNYVTAKQRKQNEITSIETQYQQDIKPAKDYLANTSEEELAKPAYIGSGSYSIYFKNFANESEGNMMVQVNESYFNNKLPAYVPQFLVVYWEWDAKKASIDFANHIDNFNFKALKEMIDK